MDTNGYQSVNPLNTDETAGYSGAPEYQQPFAYPNAAPVNAHQQPQVNPYAPDQNADHQAAVNPYAAQPYPAYAYYPQGRPVNAPQPPRRRSKPRDLILAAITAVLTFCLTDCFIWTGKLGLGFACSSALLLVTALFYLKPHWRHKSVYSAACIVLFFAACASMVFSADSGIKAITLMCMPVLYTCILMEGMDLRVWTPGTFRSTADYFYTAFAASFGKIRAGMYGLFHIERKEGSKSSFKVGKALLGLLIALPLAILLLMLLASGDPAFNGMLKSIDLGKAPEKIYSLFLAAPLFILCFCQLFSMQSIERKRSEESDKGLDPTVLLFFMVGISLVYIAYLFSQLAYFFSGFMGFLPSGFTYAEYARKGFFELTIVSTINIIVIILATALSRKKEGKLPLTIKLPALFLCVFSLLLAATEIAKMKMYMDSYGLTRLRILTTVFMIFLAIGFIALIIHVFVRGFPYLKVAVIAGVILTLTVNFVSVDRLVAEYNVNAYQNGTLQTVDMDTLNRLGDAAVPALMKLAQDKYPTVAYRAKSELYDRWKALHERVAWDSSSNSYRAGKRKDYDFRGFNTVSYQARQLLLENTELFIDVR